MFTHIQGNSSALATSGTTVTVTLLSPPTPGNLVCVAIIFADGITPATVAVSDSNGNVYTITPSSPSTGQYANAGAVYLGYLLSAPSNASASITATFNRTIVDGIITAEEFKSPTGGVKFDTDIAGSGTTGTINSPSITPAAAGELLYSYATPQNGILSCDSPWTQVTFGEDPNGGNGGYILSSNPGSTAVNMTPSVSGTWDAMAMAFLITSPIYMIAK